jgi:PmbA protein
VSRELLELAEGLVDRARPGEQLEVYAARGQETEVRAYQGEIESLSSATSAGAGIRVLLGADHRAAGAPGSTGAGDGPAEDGASRMGFAWAGSLDPSLLDETLEAARDNARFATPDPHLALAVPDTTSAADLDLWRPSEWSSDHKVAVALELERLVRGGDSRVRQVSSADYGDASVEIGLASTTGIRATSRRTSAYVSVTGIAGEGADSQTGTGFSVGRRPEDLDPERAARDAVERATRMLGATKASSMRCDVVLDPRVVSTLLAVVAGTLSGEAVVKGRSFFAGRLGEEVAAPGVTLVDDPTDERAYGASAHDAEGLACRRNALVDAGVLRAFVYDTVSARRAGTVSTGSAVRGGYASTPGAGCRAVVLEPGTMSAGEVLEAVGDGFYVQSVTGVHSGVNPISGDLSVGAEGLMIHGGELAEPVREVTVASTLQRMLQSVLHVGGDLEWLPGVAAGQTLAIADMQLSGS